MFYSKSSTENNYTLAQQALVGVPPPPQRFTLNEWYLNNRHRYRIVDDQHQLADRILGESERIRDETAETTRRNKEETDHKIQERLNDLDFLKKEINTIRENICVELDGMNTYKERIMDALQSIERDQLKICQKCILLREHRIGIDLAHDDVERELIKEMETIQSVQSMYKRCLEQVQEQIRRIKSTFYLVDRDLEDKTNAIKLDLTNSSLTESSMNLHIYHGHAPLDPSDISYEEWKNYTDKILSNVSKELNNATPLRSYIDTLINQCVQDLRTQRDLTNAAFQRRIHETKEAKTKLEIKHAETVRLANEMSLNITRIEKAIAEKEGFTALAHTRLGNRAQRDGVELCRDLVETQLVSEVQMLRMTVSQLQEILAEAQASLRYLMRCQIQLEEDINVKTNTLKIDEVDCMTLREGMDYHTY